MRISDWSSDVCSSDLHRPQQEPPQKRRAGTRITRPALLENWWARLGLNQRPLRCEHSALPLSYAPETTKRRITPPLRVRSPRSEERRVGKEYVSTFRSRV